MCIRDRDRDISKFAVPSIFGMGRRIMFNQRKKLLLHRVSIWQGHLCTDGIKIVIPNKKFNNMAGSKVQRRELWEYSYFQRKKQSIGRRTKRLSGLYPLEDNSSGDTPLSLALSAGAAAVSCSNALSGTRQLVVWTCIWTTFLDPNVRTVEA